MKASEFAAQFLFLLGALDAFDVTFLATNADGTPNDLAREEALLNLITGGVESGALVLLPGMNVGPMTEFAKIILSTMVIWKAATNRPMLP